MLACFFDILKRTYEIQIDPLPTIGILLEYCKTKHLQYIIDNAVREPIDYLWEIKVKPDLEKE